MEPSNPKSGKPRELGGGQSENFHFQGRGMCFLGAGENIFIPRGELTLLRSWGGGNFPWGG